ncbi:MAG: hypothetical protein ACRD0P_06720 [Stackebrandtia sp.]
MKRTVQRVVTTTLAAALTAAALTGITAGTAQADPPSDHHWPHDHDGLLDLDILDHDHDWDDDLIDIDIL